MAVDTHGRWPWGAAALMPLAWAWGARRARGGGGAWVGSLALPILLTHQSEEWVRPGGFLPFCNRRLLGSDRDAWPLTERDGFHVNVSVGWSSALAAALLWRRTPAPAAAVLWLEAGNAAMHGAMAVRERRYNPGLTSAALLMAPHAALGARALRRSGRLSRRGARLAALAGVGFSVAMPAALKLRMRRQAASRARRPNRRG